jgi:nitrate/nitrite transport system substrate-binding protein
LSTRIWNRMRANDPAAVVAPASTAIALRRVIEEERAAGRPPLRLAMVYPYATHNYELRYWLAAGGIDPDVDVRLSVVPPPRMVDALACGTIDGFCVGEPWSSLAVECGLGCIAATKYDIWNNSPEKVFAVPRAFAERDADRHLALLRALLEAAAWTDAAEHRSEVAEILAAERYIGAPVELLARSLTGRLVVELGGEPMQAPDFHVFHRYAANFPWTSHGIWLLTQMLRWGQIDRPLDLLATARSVYRPDLYREAARDLGIAAPSVDLKREGEHREVWILTDAGAPFAMGSDRFVDGQIFDPADPLASLAECDSRSLRVDLAALAGLNP